MADISTEEGDKLVTEAELLERLFKTRAPDRPKPWYEKTGVIPAATAVLTVVVTSLLGYYTQKSLKDKDNQLVVIRENTKLAREAAGRANLAIAGQLKLNEERLKAARGDFRSLDTTEVNKITDNTNVLQQEWRRQREDTEMELYLLFDSTSHVLPAWREARRSLDRRTDCIEQAYSEVVLTRKYNPNPVCEKEITVSDSAVVKLRGTLKAAYDQLPRQR